MASQFDTLRVHVAGPIRAIATTMLTPQNDSAKTPAPAPTHAFGISRGDDGDASC